MAGTTVLRQALKLGAGCGNSARPDLPGGRGVTLVPTGICGKKIAAQLTIKGCSERSLALCCKFYLTCSGILQTVPAKSENRQSGLQEIQQVQPVISFYATFSAPKMAQEQAFQRCFTACISFEYLMILFNLE